MKTSEFIKKVAALGYDACAEYQSIVVRNNKRTLFDIDLSEDWEIDTSYSGFTLLSWEQKKTLMSIVCEFMLTDPADREEEKRYTLRRIEPPILGEQEPRYLFYSTRQNYYDIGTTKTGYRDIIKTIFTASELAEMDITGFEPEEVEG